MGSVRSTSCTRRDRPASRRKSSRRQLASDPGAIFLKAWHGNTAIGEDDIGDVPHSIPAELGAPHTEFKAAIQVREKIREQCIAGAEQAAGNRRHDRGGTLEKSCSSPAHRTVPLGD